MKIVLVYLLLIFSTVQASAELPNAKFTPGLTNPKVTQANIKTTICVPGYAKTIRPSGWYTSSVKKKMVGSAGYPLAEGKVISDYDLDHLIPLSVGGDPKSVKNLWPQPRWDVNSSTRKDALEARAKRLVCSGKVRLRVMQRAIAKDWVAASKKYK